MSERDEDSIFVFHLPLNPKHKQTNLESSDIVTNHESLLFFLQDVTFHQ